MDLRELYQDVILDHNRNPQNFGKPDASNRQADGHNPLCGDKITVYLTVEGDRVVDLHFDGVGCAISTASASLMTESLKGRSLGDIAELFDVFHELVMGNTDVMFDGPDLGKLVAFQGVSEFPMRVKCATLCWHTLNAAIESKQDTVTTE
jgi:nitrogen fixation NifU-like protein